MVSIRLSRGGAKKRPFYHIVVTDSRNRRDGRYIERLGYFNPIATGGETELNFDLERAEYWISQGALPSGRVASLMKKLRGSEAATELPKEAASAGTGEAAGEGTNEAAGEGADEAAGEGADEAASEGADEAASDAS